ncbi:MAG: DUF1501 domain-containing protein [Phycisphaera sp.]|nr:DUF1501 domain-containing protein [Phycisphaera sp.]
MSTYYHGHKARKINHIGCPEFRRHLRQLDRRSFLRAGMVGLGGLSLADLLRNEARAATSAAPSSTPLPPKRTTSVIILWMRGGPSHIDMWDMKPEAPVEYRGEFSPMRTKVPGVQICELMPKCASIMDKWSIIRSLHGGSHSTGDQLCFTGYESGPKPDENICPSVGSIVAKQLQHKDRELPAYVMIPRMIPGTDSAYLGPACRPFETEADPANWESPFQVRNLSLPEGVSVGRFNDRKRLLGAMDQMRRDTDRSGMLDAMDEFQQQAWDIVTSPKARQAFDFDAEPKSIRQRYGLWPSFTARDPQGGGAPTWSQRMLLARRLVEAGVRLVTVDCRWWDTHQDNFWSLKTGFLPRWDQAYSALISDLDERGLLDTTLVVAWGEMGRTPRVNVRAGEGRAGRDHWEHAMSAAIAGGGVVGGRVVGSTDSKAENPKDNPKAPQDVLATIYRHLGVDYHAEYLDLTGRPRPVLPFGTPVDELF